MRRSAFQSMGTSARRDRRKKSQTPLCRSRSDTQNLDGGASGVCIGLEGSNDLFRAEAMESPTVEGVETADGQIAVRRSVTSRRCVL